MSRRSVRVAFVVVAGLATALLAGLTIMAWRQKAAEHDRAHDAWHDVQLSAARLSSLETQLAAGGYDRRERSLIQGARAGVQRGLAALEGRVHDRRAVSAALLALDRFRRAINVEARLREAGREEAAMRYHARVGDPREMALFAALTRVDGSYDDAAARVDRQADLGSLAALVGALLLVSAFMLRAQRARYAAETKLEQERMRARLEGSQRMEAVGRLAGGIAHDFNNLIGVIANCAAFVEEDLPEGESKDDAREIRRAADRAAGLTRQLLVFSRREQVAPEVLDLGAVASDMERLLRRALGEDVTLVTRYRPGVTVEADRGQLEQVLMNLAVNARDAMPEGGNLRIEVGVEDGGRQARLTVSDDGEGMDAGTSAHAFEPFFTTKGSGDGTGLGLATVYGIVTGAGGEIELHSSPGEGTTVVIRLPVVSEGSDAQPAATAAAAGGRGETVLLIEDDASLRSTTRRVLVDHGYAVVEADGAAAATEAAQRHDGAIDLILADVVMPGVSGPELVERLRRSCPHAGVLFTSGYTQDVIAREGLSGVAAVVLEKPVRPETLLDAVAQSLAARTPEREETAPAAA